MCTLPCISKQGSFYQAKASLQGKCKCKPLAAGTGSCWRWAYWPSHIWVSYLRGGQVYWDLGAICGFLLCPLSNSPVLWEDLVEVPWGRMSFLQSLSRDISHNPLLYRALLLRVPSIRLSSHPLY